MAQIGGDFNGDPFAGVYFPSICLSPKVSYHFLDAVKHGNNNPWGNDTIQTSRIVRWGKFVWEYNFYCADSDWKCASALRKQWEQPNFNLVTDLTKCCTCERATKKWCFLKVECYANEEKYKVMGLDRGAARKATHAPDRGATFRIACGVPTERW